MFPIEYLRFFSNEREKEVEDRIEQAGEEAEEE